MYHGEHGGVAEQRFAGAGGGRVALVGGAGVFGQHFAHLGNTLHKFHGHFTGGHVTATAIGGVVGAGKTAATADLFGEQAEDGIEIGGHVVAQGFAVHLRRAEVPREEQGLEPLHHFTELFLRRQ